MQLDRQNHSQLLSVVVEAGAKRAMATGVLPRVQLWLLITALERRDRQRDPITI